MKKLLGFFFLNLCAVSVYCQTNFRPGFIITNDKDTIHGKVDYRRDTRMCKVCTFKEKGSSKRYLPGEIIGYKFENGRYFETANVDGKTKFLEILIDGEVSIYYFSDKDRSIYYFKKGNGVLTELKYFERTVHFDENGKASDGNKYIIANENTSHIKIYVAGEYFIKSQEFKEILYKSLQNKPEIIDEITRLKKPNHSGLINLAKRYNEISMHQENSCVSQSQY